MSSGMSRMRAISTKMSGSSTSEGWKKAKQRRSAGSRRRRRSSQPWISCTASYWMIFSRMAAGVCQSMRRRTKKPRLNHDASRCIRSRSTEASAGSPMLSISWRMATIWAVAPGARLSRRGWTLADIWHHRHREPLMNRTFASLILARASCLVALLAVGAQSRVASASTVYSNDFESNTAGFANGGVLPPLTRTSLPTDGGGLSSPNQSMA